MLNLSLDLVLNKDIFNILLKCFFINGHLKALSSAWDALVSGVFALRLNKDLQILNSLWFIYGLDAASSL